MIRVTVETSPEETLDPSNAKYQYIVDSLKREFIQRLEVAYQRSCQNRNNLLYLIEALARHEPTLTSKMILIEKGTILIASCRKGRILLRDIEFKGGIINKFKLERINAELELLAHRHEETSYQPPTSDPTFNRQGNFSLWQEIAAQGEEVTRQLGNQFNQFTKVIKEGIDSITTHWRMITI
uniref:DHC_N1 domain-containing protein n=1 Tax=Loa loa TaxID=7209 RepID=A0A1I7W3F9_LOALO